MNNGDTIQVIGNFNAPLTSLNFNTITIDGEAGDDTIDISALDIGTPHRLQVQRRQRHDHRHPAGRGRDRTADGATIADYVKTDDAMV